MHGLQQERLFGVLQAVKALKTVQEETSEDFSSADEWQTAKAKLRWYVATCHHLAHLMHKTCVSQHLGSRDAAAPYAVPRCLRS